MVEDRPGPTSIDPASSPDAPVFRTAGRPEELAEGKLSLNISRPVLAEVVARRAVGDPHLEYLEGRELFGVRDWETMPMPDLLHPDPVGQRHIDERFAALLPTLEPSRTVIRGTRERGAPRGQAGPSAGNRRTPPVVAVVINKLPV